MATPGGRGLRVEPAELRGLPLRAHEFLKDVPLHDVWRLRLRGGGPDVSVTEVLDRFAHMDPSGVNPSVRVLFPLRMGLGRVLGWDREDASASHRSYASRLSAEDRSRSVVEPGSKQGFWTSLYAFEHEALGEVVNRTVHAFLLFATVPAEDGHTLYWGIYVKPVGRFTPLYMALIDPFRRHLVYPPLIRRFEAAWKEDSGRP